MTRFNLEIFFSLQEQLECIRLPALTLDKASSYRVINNNDENEDFNQSLENCSVIAIDCEWDKNRKESVEIDGKRYNFYPIEMLQLCILIRKNKEDCVIYLLDVRKILSKQVRDILSDIFQANDILKLGFDDRNDVRNFSLTLMYKGLAGCNKVLIFHFIFF